MSRWVLRAERRPRADWLKGFLLSRSGALRNQGLERSDRQSDKRGGTAGRMPVPEEGRVFVVGFLLAKGWMAMSQSVDWQRAAYMFSFAVDVRRGDAV